MSLYIPCVRLYCNIIATVVPYDRYPDAVVKLVPFSYMDVPSVFPCTKVFPFAEAVIGKMEYSAVGTLCRDVMEIFVFRDLSAHAVREFYPFPDVRFLILLHPPVFRAQAFAFEEMRIVQDIGFLILGLRDDMVLVDPFYDRCFHAVDCVSCLADVRFPSIPTVGPSGFLAVLLYVMRDDSSCKEVIVTLVCNRPAVLEFYGNDIDAFRIRYGHHHSAFRQVPIADDQTEAGENPYHPEEDNDTKQEPDCPPRSLAATKQ